MRYAAVVLMLLCIALPVWAADTVQPAQAASFSLQLNDVDMLQAFTDISKQGGISILGDSTVKGKVSCDLSNVTADRALDVICKTNKLEWVKVSTPAGQDAKLSPSRLFLLFDYLKLLGGSPVIYEDPKTQSRTIFIPAASASSTDLSSVTANLRLKTVYLVRAIPEPKSDAAKESDKQDKSGAQKNANTAPDSAASAMAATPNDPRAAATQVWDYFSKMTPDQRNSVFRELRQLFMDSMTPEQRDAMRNWRGRGNRGGGGPGQPGQ